MRKEEDKIDNLFRERFSEDEAPISPRVWESIKETLPKETNSNFHIWGNKNILKISLLLLTIGAVAGASLFLYKKTDPTFVSTNENSDILLTKKQTRKTDNNSINEITLLNNTNTASTINEVESFDLKNERRTKKINSTDIPATIINDNDNDSENKKTGGSIKASVISLNKAKINKKQNLKSKGNAGNTTQNPTTPLPENKKIRANTVSKSKKDSTILKNTAQENIEPINSIALAKINSNNTFNTNKSNDNTSFADSIGNYSQLNSSKSPILSDTSNNENSSQDASIKFLSSTKTSDTLLVIISEDSTTKEIIDSTVATTSDSEIKESENIKKESKFSIDLLISPMISGIKNNALNNNSNDIAISKNNQGKNQFALSGGVLLNYAASNKLLVSTGVFYSNYSELYDFKNTKTYDSITTSSYFVLDTIYVSSQDSIPVIDTVYTNTQYSYTTIQSTDSNYTAKKKDSYQLISIPITASYYIWKNKNFVVSLTAGIKANLFINGVTYVANEQGTDLTAIKSGFSKFTISYLAACGIEYKLLKNVNFIAQPSFNYHGNSIINENSSLAQKPYSIGLNLGLRIKL